MKESIKIQLDEKVVLKFRKHWFVLFQDCLPTFLVGLAPFIGFPVALSLHIVPEPFNSPAIIGFAVAWWLIVVWSSLCVQWTNYFLDLWIITDRRIINVGQVSLFDRVTTIWRLDRVQAVTISVENFFQTLLGYGSLKVQTAGPSDEFTIIQGVRDPEYVQRVIMNELDHFDPAHLSR